MKLLMSAISLRYRLFRKCKTNLQQALPMLWQSRRHYRFHRTNILPLSLPLSVFLLPPPLFLSVCLFLSPSVCCSVCHGIWVGEDTAGTRCSTFLTFWSSCSSSFVLTPMYMSKMLIFHCKFWKALSLVKRGVCSAVPSEEQMWCYMTTESWVELSGCVPIV